MTKYVKTSCIYRIWTEDKSPNPYLFHKPEKRFFGRVTQKAGYYSSGIFGKDEFISDVLPEHFLLVDGIIYYKPQVCVLFSSQHKATKRFDTIDEADRYAYELTITDKLWVEL